MAAKKKRPQVTNVRIHRFEGDVSEIEIVGLAKKQPKSQLAKAKRRLQAK